MAKLKLPKDCLKSDVCKYVGDSGCLEGCDYRLEHNSDIVKCGECNEDMALIHSHYCSNVICPSNKIKG
jgi:hypothetical protein